MRVYRLVCTSVWNGANAAAGRLHGGLFSIFFRIFCFCWPVWPLALDCVAICMSYPHSLLIFRIINAADVGPVRPTIAPTRTTPNGGELSSLSRLPFTGFSVTTSVLVFEKHRFQGRVVSNVLQE